jgi:Protein ChrB, N-terminal
MAGELLSSLQEQGADGQFFAATALGADIEKDLLRRFRGLRDEEYAELIERCQGLLAELAKETKKRKFTFAELEENEDELQKLESWLARIQTRDLVGGERAAEALRSVESCKKALGIFAGHVYAQEEMDPKENSSR